MTKQEIQIIAKVVQKIVQVEVAKSQKKLLSEIALLKNNQPVLTEKIIKNKVVSDNSRAPLSLDVIREMVGSSIVPGEFDSYDDDLPPTVNHSDPTNVFMKDYSATLKKMEDATNPFRNSL